VTVSSAGGSIKELADLLGLLVVVTDGLQGVTINGAPYHPDDGGWVRGEPPWTWTGLKSDRRATAPAAASPVQAAGDPEQAPLPLAGLGAEERQHPLRVSAGQPLGHGRTSSRPRPPG
jgi:hypothetical protein